MQPPPPSANGTGALNPFLSNPMPETALTAASQTTSPPTQQGSSSSATEESLILDASSGGTSLPSTSARANAPTSGTGATMIPALNVFAAAGLSESECAAELRTDAKTGLPSAEASRRLAYFGHNEFEHDAKEPIWKKYVEQFQNPLILLLLASAIVSVIMKQFDDAISITIAVVIVVTVGFVQEYRSEQTLEKLNNMVPPTAHCIRDGRSVQFLARDLVPGDMVTLNMGDWVPADVRVTESIDLQIDESSFTGENEPRHKSVGSLTAPSATGIEHLDNVAFMGTLISSGRGKGIVIATGGNTKFGEMWQMMRQQESPKTPLQNSMDQLGKQLSLYSFGVIAVIFFIGLLQGRAVLDMFTIGVSLAVAAIPEGLPVVVAVTLAIGVVRMGNRQAVVKKLSAVETLGCVTVICSDKTGTLTKNEMTAAVVVSADGIQAKVTGVGYDPTDGTCTTENGERVSGYSHPAISRVIEIGAVCNNAQVINGTILGQPTEGALAVLAAKTQLDIAASYFQRVHEVPFSSDRKWMAVHVHPGNQPNNVEIFLKGAFDRIIEMCPLYYAAGTRQLPFTPPAKEAALQAARGVSNSGLRVIAVASGRNLDSLAYAGFVGILDPPRPGCKESVEVVQSAGVAVKMITGDAIETACSIGSRLHIFTPTDTCLSGAQIDELSDSELELVIKNTVIFYRASPRHKLRIVKALQSMGEVVAMTGDGVNDAAALKISDIGIAMGVTGTDVCKEAADMVLVNDDFMTIRGAIEEGKGIYHNITNFVRFQLSTSVSALSLIALSTLFHFENPLNAMQILWINIIMDGPPAQSLGVEPVDADIIKQPPRDVKQPMMTKNLIVNVLSSAALIIIGTMFVFYREMSADNKITPRDTTMTFTCFVFFDMWNALSCRSSRKLIWEIGILRNKMFCIAVSLSIIGQLAVIYLPPLQAIFQTEALSFFDLVFLTVLTSTVFIFNETKKYLDLRSCNAKINYHHPDQNQTI